MAYQNLFEQLQETCDFIALEDDMNQIINALEKDLIEQGQTLPLVDVRFSLKLKDKIIELNKEIRELKSNNNLLRLQKTEFENLYNNKKNKKVEIKKKCKHPLSSIESLQGGQIDRCRKCGKEWG